MSMIDLHLHSKHSEHPSEWFLQRLGAKESYTCPEYIYKTALERGMDFVTITDHNRIDGAFLLKNKYPEKVITGVESTTYFPEDGCKIHILHYGINESQFKEIQKLRKDIYELREYIKENDIAHSVAHATYSVNGKLKVEHIEKLILLFDIFEGLNGGRNYLFNTSWMEILKRLIPSQIEKLYGKYRIEPMSEEPWLKGFTGGSDDHSGLFVANTFTNLKAKNTTEILESIKNKKSYPAGRHTNYKSFAYAVYKVAYDFLKESGKSNKSFFFKISKEIFEPGPDNIKKRFQLKKLKSSSKKKNDKIKKLLVETMEEIKKVDPTKIEKRLDIVYEKISNVADEFFKRVFESLEKDIFAGNITSLIMNISSSIPGLFLSVPFFSSMMHMYHNRNIIEQIKSNLSIKLPKGGKRILWFTDTLNDLNGVSETLKEMGMHSKKLGCNIKIVTCLKEEEKDTTLPANIIYLPDFFNTRLPHYESLLIKFPSVLKSIDILYREEPTEIIISTPGPVGLTGILLSRLLNIKCIGIYHTDFKSEAEKIIGDDNFPLNLIENYIKWFYSKMDTIKSPTKEYLSILKKRGFKDSKLSLFKRGIDSEIFSFKPGAKEFLEKSCGIKNGKLNLLYTGRVSEDKNLDFLLDIYNLITQKEKDVNLIIAGDGPYLRSLQKRAKNNNSIYFLGRIPRKKLPNIYSASDIFLFPSTTDTFGMVVLEAQACGVPAIVSDIGGPKEIIINGKTGFVAKNNDLEQWVEKIEKLKRTIKDENKREALRNLSRNNIIRKHDWKNVLKEIVSPKTKDKSEIIL